MVKQRYFIFKRLYATSPKYRRLNGHYRGMFPVKNIENVTIKIG